MYIQPTVFCFKKTEKREREREESEFFSGLEKKKNPPKKQKKVVSLFSSLTCPRPAELLAGALEAERARDGHGGVNEVVVLLSPAVGLVRAVAEMPPRFLLLVLLFFFPAAVAAAALRVSSSPAPLSSSSTSSCSSAPVVPVACVLLPEVLGQDDRAQTEPDRHHGRRQRELPPRLRRRARDVGGERRRVGPRARQRQAAAASVDDGRGAEAAPRGGVGAEGPDVALGGAAGEAVEDQEERGGRRESWGGRRRRRRRR